MGSNEDTRREIGGNAMARGFPDEPELYSLRLERRKVHSVKVSELTTTVTLRRYVLSLV